MNNRCRLTRLTAPGLAAAALLLSACGVDRGGIVDPPTTATPIVTEPVVAVGPAVRQAGSFDVSDTTWNTDTASVQADGAVATLDDIEEGDYVVVVGAGAMMPVADSIVLNRQVIGPVSAVDVPAGTLNIFAQTVRTSTATVFAAPYDMDGLAGVMPADDLTVSGTRLADGSILASRIAPNANSLPPLVAGPVDSLDASAGTFAIAGLNVIDLTLTLSDGFNGQVRVSDFTENAGTIAGGVVEVLADQSIGIDSVMGLTLPAIGSDPIAVRIDAPVLDVPGVSGGALVVGGLVIVTDAATEFVGFTEADLAVDQTVRVTGSSADQGQTVLAARITLLTPPVTAYLQFSDTKLTRSVRP